MRNSGLKLLISFALTLALSTGFVLLDVNQAQSDPLVTFDNLNPVDTSIIAYKNVNDYIDSLPALTVKPVTYIGPTVGDRDTKLSLMGMDRVSTLWSQFVKPEKLNIVLHTELDGAWADQKQIDFTGEWLQTDALPSKRLQKYGCNIGGMYLPGLLLFCVKGYTIPTDTVEYYAEAHKFAHEYTHFMEMNLKDWMAHARGKGIGTRNPCWIEEGFATFYGFAVGSNALDPSGKLRREFTTNLTFDYDKRRNEPDGTLAKLITQGNPAETKRLFGMLENTPWPCEETQNAYSLGSMAAEALVAVKGQEGMNNFYKASARTGDWKASFQEAFGLSVDDFYVKLTPYLASQFNPNNFKYESKTLGPTVIPNPAVSPTPTATPSPAVETKITVNPSSTKSATILKTTTITCLKGKTVKKVTAVKPICPLGYKKKL